MHTQYSLLDDFCSTASVTETENVAEDNVSGQKISKCGTCDAQTVLASTISISSSLQTKVWERGFNKMMYKHYK